MNKIGISALVLVATAGSAFGQTLNFRIVAVTSTAAGGQASNYNSNGTGASPAPFTTPGTPANSFSGAGPYLDTRTNAQSYPPVQGTAASGLVTAVNAQAAANLSGSTTIAAGGKVAFVLQAQWVGISGAVGLASAGGFVTTNEQAGRANIDRLVESAYNQASTDDQIAGQRNVWGTFAPYDALPFNSSYTDPNANGNPNTTTNAGFWGIDDIRGLQTGGNAATLASGTWANIYAWSYMDMGGPTRDVTFSFADAARYSAPFNGFSGGQPNPVDSSLFTTGTAAFTLHVLGVPAPGTAALLGLGGLVAARRRRIA